MSIARRAETPARKTRACEPCRRRSWLLGELAGPLDRCARDAGRLLEVLALDEHDLLAALAGRRRRELEDASHRSDAVPARRAEVSEVCAHDPHYPARLRTPRCPRMLFLTGGAQRLQTLASGDVVAIVGSSRPSDYGAEVARGLGRELAASGVAIATTLQRGIAACAQEGAAEVGGATLAVACAGLGRDQMARSTGWVDGLAASGCSLAELPCGHSGRSFGAIAAQRTLAALATVVLVVESPGSPRELLAARIAAASGQRVAAVPGPITAPGSVGPHALLRNGATLARGADDVLELLADLADRGPASTRSRQASVRLPARLAEVLERVSEGQVTATQLCAQERDPGAILLALTELELLDLLGRGATGRYVRRVAAHSARVQSSSEPPPVQATARVSRPTHLR